MSNPHIDLMFKAFADETRLRILHLLTSRELCVCDLMEVLHVPQSKVSRHLATLRKAGLVTSRPEGLWKHYSLTPAEGNFHRGLIECLSGCFNEVSVLQKDHEHLNKWLKEKSRCPT